MVDLATKSLVHDKLRFLITVSGVAFAVTLIFVQVGLFLGLMDTASLTLEEIDGRRLKIIGRTVDAQSFTTTPLTFIDYRLAQSLIPAELRGNTTYIRVKLAPGANIDAVRAEIRRRLPHNDVYTKPEWAKRS